MTFDLQNAGQDDGPLDTRVRLITPERIVFEFPLAGPFPRFCSYLVDQICILILLMISTTGSLVLFAGSGAGSGMMLVAYFLLTWGYGAFLEGIFNGRTLGKSLTGLRVVTDQGVPIGIVQAIVRNVAGAFDSLIPFFFLPALTSMVLTQKFQRLGDLAAGTMVVHDEQRGRFAIIRVREPAVEALIAGLPIRLPAGPELTRALADYVRHRHRFGGPRRAEMAEPLARPLRAQLGLSDEVLADTLLCAVYHRVLVGE